MVAVKCEKSYENILNQYKQYSKHTLRRLMVSIFVWKLTVSWVVEEKINF